MGPPSGTQGGGQMNNFNQTPGFDYHQHDFKPSDSFKNPWTTIPRPMNGFMDLDSVQYERHEKEK